MKKLLVIIVLGLLWSGNAYANDIKDIQIEGMSIGDSLLDYYPEEEIKKGFPENWSYKNKTYQNTYLHKNNSHKNLKKYETVQVNYKTKDKNYTIVSLEGIVGMGFKECLKEKEVALESVKPFLVGVKYIGGGTKKHSYDKTGDSKVDNTIFEFKLKGRFVLECTDWSDKLTSSKGWADIFKVRLYTKKFDKFLLRAY